jgi:ribosomal protein L31E
MTALQSHDNFRKAQPALRASRVIMNGKEFLTTHEKLRVIQVYLEGHTNEVFYDRGQKNSALL